MKYNFRSLPLPTKREIDICCVPPWRIYDDLDAGFVGCYNASAWIVIASLASSGKSPGACHAITR